MTAPALPEVREYLGQGGLAYTDGQIVSALAAETLAQTRVCVIPEGDLPADLAEARMRRVARNLAMRNVPLGVQMDDGGGMRIGSSDPEVRRLESPYRRLAVG